MPPFFHPLPVVPGHSDDTNSSRNCQPLSFMPDFLSTLDTFLVVRRCKHRRRIRGRLWTKVLAGAQPQSLPLSYWTQLFGRKGPTTTGHQAVIRNRNRIGGGNLSRGATRTRLGR